MGIRNERGEKKGSAPPVPPPFLLLLLCPMFSISSTTVGELKRERKTREEKGKKGRRVEA